MLHQDGSLGSWEEAGGGDVQTSQTYTAPAPIRHYSPAVAVCLLLECSQKTSFEWQYLETIRLYYYQLTKAGSDRYKEKISVV